MAPDLDRERDDGWISHGGGWREEAGQDKARAGMGGPRDIGSGREGRGHEKQTWPPSPCHLGSATLAACTPAQPTMELLGAPKNLRAFLKL